jgi:hypothetical protein
MTARTRHPITSSVTTFLDGRRKQAAARRHIQLLIPGALPRSSHHRAHGKKQQQASERPNYLLCTGCNIVGAPVMSRGGAIDRANVTDWEDVTDRADVADRVKVADQADAGSDHGPDSY